MCRGKWPKGSCRQVLTHVRPESIPESESESTPEGRSRSRSYLESHRLRNPARQQWRNQVGSEGSADPPKCLEGPAPTWVFCDLPAVKLFRRGLESWKLLTKRAHNNIQLPERAPTGAVTPLAKGNYCQIGPFQKKLLSKRALSNIHLTERRAGPCWNCRCEDGPFQKKLLLKRALSNIHLPDRAPTEAIKTGPSKRNCCRSELLATST